MIPRHLTPKLREVAGYYPVAVVTGPRQSGKTTVCRAAFPAHRYVSLEALDSREYATTDPRGFLNEYRNGVILDEIQNVPGLLSYLQEVVDADPAPGRFVLTGSQQFNLAASISQSLAGRCGMLTLLPPTFAELQAFPNAPTNLLDALFNGAYPRIFDRKIPASRWLADYAATYIQRDVRQIVNVGDLQSFTAFLTLCAGHTAQEINLARLGSGAGVVHNTARAWLSVLETSYIVHRLPPWHTNVKKQVVKAAKLHFIDSGLACHLLGIRNAEQLRAHPLRGAIFESWVVSEVLKSFMNRGLSPDLRHYRETRGMEVDLLIAGAGQVSAVEMKSGATIAAQWFTNLDRFGERLNNAHDVLRQFIVYGGDEGQSRSNCTVLSWRDVGRLSA